MPQSDMPRPRWGLLLWPLVVVAVLAGGAMLAVRMANENERQQVVMGSVLILAATAALSLVWTLIWLLGPSRLRWRSRLLGLAGLVLVGAALAGSVTVRDFTGDMRPMLGWRWGGSAPASGPVEPSAGAAGGGQVASANDFPGFLGAARDGRIDDVRITMWTEPPRELWRRPVGEAWSGFAVAGDFAVTQEQRGDEELVTCYDRDTGAVRWSHADDTRWEDFLGGVGPRATPTIHEGKVVTFGGTGRLNVLDLVTGELLWAVDTVADDGGRIPEYGTSASPLVVDGRVIVPVGGRDGRSVVAYDLETGERVWSGGDDPPAYSSPMHVVLDGVPQILVLNDAAVVSHDAVDGQPLWRFEWPDETQNASQPVLLPDGRVFLSTGYGIGGKMLRPARDAVGAWRVDMKWESRSLKAKFTNVVFHQGHLYGLDDGILVCVDPANGKRLWKRGRYGHGQVLLVGGDLLVLAEDGEVFLLDIAPDAMTELASFQAVTGKTWNHPALAGRVLIVRNDREAAAFELPVELGTGGER